MNDYPAMFKPDRKLEVSVRLPMVYLTFQPWMGAALKHDFGNKGLVDQDGTGIFAELAIRHLVTAVEGWSARWVCTFGAKAKEPRYLSSWNDDAPLGEQEETPLDPEQDVLLAKIAKQNHDSYSGCWDVLAWKGERTLFVEAKHNKKDHIRATQLQWRWAALRAGLAPESFVVAQWEFG